MASERKPERYQRYFDLGAFVANFVPTRLIGICRKLFGWPSIFEIGWQFSLPVRA